MMSTTIYRAPESAQPTSNLLTAELLLDVLQKVPKDTKICIFRDYEGDGGYYYVSYIVYDAEKKRLTINADGEPNSKNADEIDAGADWASDDSDDEE